MHCIQKEYVVSYEMKDGFYLSPGNPRGADGPAARGRGNPRSVPAGDVHPIAPEYSELQILDAIPRMLAFVREGRELYYAAAQPLSEQMISAVGPFFSPELLTSARVVKLSACRLSNPSFYPEIRAKGFNNLPDFAHMTSVTFLDVVVFNEGITARNLLHALVHVAQFEILGIGRYVELLLRGFLRTKSYSLAPLKAHAFALDGRYARNKNDIFSVEEEVREWVREDRY